MDIVINIQDNYYERLVTDFNNVTDSVSIGVKDILFSVKNGTPLPKGHGDLIDKGKFKKWIDTQDGDKLMTEYYLDALDMQETIVGGSHDGDID